jgi:hypothetical protein
LKDVQVHGRLAGGAKLNKAALLAQLKAMPDGALAGILWIWPRMMAGHTIACEKIGGKLHFIDPQSGEIGAQTLGKASQRLDIHFTAWMTAHYAMTLNGKK